MPLSPMLLSGTEDKFYSTTAAKGAKLPLRCSGADFRAYYGRKHCPDAIIVVREPVCAQRPAMVRRSISNAFGRGDIGLRR